MSDTPPEDALHAEDEATAVATEATETATEEAPIATDQTDQDTAAETEAEADTEANEPVEIPEHLDLKVEAALLTADRATTSNKIGEALGGLPGKIITEAIERLNETYAQTERSFRIEKVAGGWQMMTLAEFSDVLNSMHKSRSQAKLRPAALETLAIIAYKQPIIRADIEAIRGVACGEVLRSLLERHLIKIVGRAEEIGRPMLYGTTKSFLEIFGLASLKDLPKANELKPSV